jgi:hypothetical protein
MLHHARQHDYGLWKKRQHRRQNRWQRPRGRLRVSKMNVQPGHAKRMLQIVRPFLYLLSHPTSSTFHTCFVATRILLTFYACIPFDFGTGFADETKKATAEMKKRMLDALKEAERIADLERLLSGTRSDADKNQVSSMPVLSSRCCS